jgi:hypothetical protein
MLVRAQVTFQGGTNLPEDRFINTFHFSKPGWATLAAAVAEIDGPLKTMYTAPYVGNTIGSMTSPFVMRAFTVRYYDMAQAEPRVPLITNGTLPAVTSGGIALPEEAAIVSSFHGSPPVTPRKRGRVYLGPLNHFVLTAGTTTAPTRVAANVRTSLAGAFTALAAANVGWVVYSPTGSLETPVVAGFINDDVDTQRRRGPDASARSIWALP